MEAVHSVSPILAWATSLTQFEAVDVDNWPPKCNLRQFDWTVPTNVAYYDPHSGFADRFKEARKLLDYNYHHNLMVSRQELQDAILARIANAAMDSCEDDGDEANAGVGSRPGLDFGAKTGTGSSKRSAQRPWIVFSGGAMGVGKGYTLSTLNKMGAFKLSRFVVIDPDKLKSELPEMAGYLREEPETAATKLHRESTQMSDVLFNYALAQGKCMLVDGSLRDVEWHRQLFADVRDNHPQYRIGIIHVSAKRETVHARAQKRGEVSGRFVPVETIDESYSQVPKSVHQLAPLSDLTYELSNEDHSPVGIVSCQVRGEYVDVTDYTWDDFEASWERPDEPIEAEGSEVEDKRDLECDNILRRRTTNGPDRRIKKVGRRRRMSLVRDGGMGDCYNDPRAHDAAMDIWSKAYPNFCARCTLVTDRTCGVCVHGKHYCACEACNPSAGSIKKYRLNMVQQKS